MSPPAWPAPSAGALERRRLRLMRTAEKDLYKDLHKVRDYIHPYRGLPGEWASGFLTLHGGVSEWGVCRVRIYERADYSVYSTGSTGCWSPGALVVVSELAENPNSPVSELFEVLAVELCAAHALPTLTTTFIEHYERSEADLTLGIPETCSIVEFDDREPGLLAWGTEIRMAFGEPDFEYVRAECVEGLIGEPLSDRLQRFAEVA